MADIIFNVLEVTKNAVLVDRLIKRDFNGVFGCSIAGLSVAFLNAIYVADKCFRRRKCTAGGMTYLAIHGFFVLQEIFLSSYMMFWTQKFSTSRTDGGRVYGIVAATLLMAQNIIQPLIFGIYVTSRTGEDPSVSLTDPGDPVFEGRIT